MALEEAVSGMKRQTRVSKTPHLSNGDDAGISGNLPSPGGGGRVNRPGSRRKRTDFGNRNVPPHTPPHVLWAQVWDGGAARAGGLGHSNGVEVPGPEPLRLRLLTRGAACGVFAAGGDSALQKPAERSRVPASAGMRRGAPRTPEKKPQQRARTRRANGGGARRSAARARKRRARRGGRSGGARWCGTAGRIAGDGPLSPPTLPPPLTPTSAEKEGRRGPLERGGRGEVRGNRVG